MALFFLFADDASNHLSGHNFSSTRYTRALVCVCEPVSLNWLNGEKGGVSVCTKVWLQRWEPANPVTYPSWFWLLWSGSSFHKHILCLPADHFGLLKLLSSRVFCFGKHKSTPIQFQLQLCPMQVVQYSLLASVAKLLSTTLHLHSRLESTWCTYSVKDFLEDFSPSSLRFASFSSIVLILRTINILLANFFTLLCW